MFVSVKLVEDIVWWLVKCIIEKKYMIFIIEYTWGGIADRIEVSHSFYDIYGIYGIYYISYKYKIRIISVFLINFIS